MNSKLFRQVSLDRLSSPEQLDQLLRITSLRAWVILAALLMLLTAGIIWALEGHIVTTSTGTGVIVRQGGVLNVVTHGAGVVTDIRVKPGTRVTANEIMATIAQPALAQQLHLLESARAEAMNNRTQNLKLEEDSSQLKNDANLRQHVNLRAQISEYQEESKLLKEQIDVEQQLFTKGLVTNQQVLDMKQKAVGLEDQVATANAQLKQLDADRFSIAAQPKQQDVPLLTRVTELDRQILDAKEKLELAQEVKSPYDGEVLEVQTSPGSTVAEAQPIVSIQPRQESLELVAYMPSLLAKNVRVGMDTEISPSNVKREEYGFIRGRVNFVADYPSTQAAMMRNFANDTLVRALTANESLTETGPVTEIHVSLTDNAATRSGFQWSTSQGPDVIITSGTICKVDIVTKREKPATLVAPFLKSVLR